MAYVYILYSNSIDNYYIGSCKDMECRLEQHANNHFKTGFTKRAKDWNIFFLLENLNQQQARDIEKHIKKMKSRTYIQNLKKYPEISKKLMLKYE